MAAATTVRTGQLANRVALVTTNLAVQLAAAIADSVRELTGGTTMATSSGPAGCVNIGVLSHGRMGLDEVGRCWLHKLMARPLRIERPGGRYHVTDRGNERKRIFHEDADRSHFLELVSELGERFGVRVHASVREQLAAIQNQLST